MVASSDQNSAPLQSKTRLCLICAPVGPSEAPLDCSLRRLRDLFPVVPALPAPLPPLEFGESLLLLLFCFVFSWPCCALHHPCAPFPFPCHYAYSYPSLWYETSGPDKTRARGLLEGSEALSPPLPWRLQLPQTLVSAALQHPAGRFRFVVPSRFWPCSRIEGSASFEPHLRRRGARPWLDVLLATQH